MRREGPPCIDCSGPTTKRSKSGRCVPCMYAAKRRPARHCVDCGVEVSRCSRGRCRSCSATALNADASLKQRRVDGIRRKFAEDPAHREKMAKVARRNGAGFWLDPAHRDEAVARGQRLYKQFLSKPEVRARCNEAIRANSWKISDHHLAWCPAEYRDEYRALKARLRYAPKARAAIEQRIREERAVKHPAWGSVIDFLRRLAPVIRLDNGNYRFGITELTPGELLERAEAKGFELTRRAA